MNRGLFRRAIVQSGALDAAADMHRRLVGEAVNATRSLAIDGAGKSVLLGLCAAIGALK